MVAPGLFVWDWSEGVERTRYRPPRLAKGVYRKRDRKPGHPGLARLVVASPPNELWTSADSDSSKACLAGDLSRRDENQKPRSLTQV